jgi:hypothetical protein
MVGLFGHLYICGGMLLSLLIIDCFQFLYLHKN